MEVEKAEGDEDTGGDMLRPINPKDELSFYKPPTLDLLDEYEQSVHSIDKDEQAENANNIVKALRNFGIEISSIKVIVFFFCLRMWKNILQNENISLQNQAFF